MFDIVPCTAKRVQVDPTFVREVEKNLRIRGVIYLCLGLLTFIQPILSIFCIGWNAHFSRLIISVSIFSTMGGIIFAFMGVFSFIAAKRWIVVEVATAGGIVYALNNGKKWTDYGPMVGYGITNEGKLLSLQFERRSWYDPYVISFIPNNMDAEACKSYLDLELSDLPPFKSHLAAKHKAQRQRSTNELKECDGCQSEEGSPNSINKWQRFKSCRSFPTINNAEEQV